MAVPRILLVLEASTGGAKRHVLELLRGLDRARFELHLACSAERDPDAAGDIEALRHEGFTVATVPMLRRPAPLADLRALAALTRLMGAGRYQLVHTHAAKAGYLGRLAARRAGVPAVVHTPHTFPFERTDTCLAPFYGFLERRAARWADRIVLVAESQREVAARGGIGPPERLVVVENGIRLPEEEPSGLRERYRRELGLEEGTPAFAFVGRLTPQKDVQAFLSVAAEVRRALPGAQAFIVGGADNPRYVRSLRPRVSEAAWRRVTGREAPEQAVPWCCDEELPLRVLGHRRDAADLVAAFDAVVMPSRYEGLPYSLLDAMARRVPVVATGVTGNRDVIEHERSGFLAPVGDVAELARLTVKLLRDEACRRQVGAAARERVATAFTQERFLRRMTELYEGLLAR